MRALCFVLFLLLPTSCVVVGGCAASRSFGSFFPVQQTTIIAGLATLSCEVPVLFGELATNTDENLKQTRATAAVVDFI